MVKKVLGILILVGVVSLLIWSFWPRSPQSIIKQKLYDLAALVAKPAGCGNIELAVRSQQIPRYLTDSCDFDIKGSGLNGPQNATSLAEMVTKVNLQLQSSSLQISDVDIEMQGENRAQVTFSCRYALHHTNRPDIDAYGEVKANAVKVDGQWLFTAFTVAPIIRK